MQNKYVFFGVIMPERALINMEANIPLKLDHTFNGIKGDLLVSIRKNQIIVDFTTAEKVSNYNTLKNMVSESISTIIDCVGVNFVVGYSVDMRAMYDVQDQKEYVFGVSEYLPEITIGDNEIRKTDITEMLKVSYQPNVQSALSDFKYAILCPKDTGLFCHRAFESLIHFIMDEENINNKKTAIMRMVEITKIDNKCFNFLRILNMEVRHGKPVWISGENRVKALQITRELILRFILYRNSEPNISPIFEHYTVF